MRKVYCIYNPTVFSLAEAIDQVAETEKDGIHFYDNPGKLKSFKNALKGQKVYLLGFLPSTYDLEALTKEVPCDVVVLPNTPRQPV